MRWIKQKDKYSCVPIMFLNVLKWTSKKATYKKHLSTWKKKCNTNKDGSITWRHNWRNFSAKKKVHPKIADIKKAINNGMIVAMASAFKYQGQVGSHIFLVVDADKKGLFCINVGETHRWISNKKFAKLYLEKHVCICGACDEQTYPQAWFIKKD